MLSILSYLVTFSLWVSLAAAACPLLACTVYGIPYNPIWSIVAFLCAFFVYSMDKISGSMEDLLNTPERAILAYYPIRQLAIMAYVAAFLITFAADWTKWYCVAVFGLAGCLYAQPIHGLSMVYPWWRPTDIEYQNYHGSARSTMVLRLKDIPGLKGPYVAAVWSVSFAGLVGAGYSLIFLLILINTILFDIRDLVGDRAAGVQTIPVMLGASRTVWLLVGADLVLAVVHLPSALIGAVLIWYFRQSRPSLQYDLLVDGWPVVSLVLIYFTELEKYL